FTTPPPPPSPLFPYTTLFRSLARIPPTLDEAARSLGVTMRGALRRVHLPLMRGGILSALTLIWVETIKELPATLLLRPFGLKTRSEEHTSELQSRSDLVCRLL